MKCPPIEVPEQLVTAIETGNLVVFAGAGVSRSAPADVGSYTELGARIAKKVGAGPAVSNELPDVYLARLHQEGLRVHEACQQIVGSATQPNDLHRLILALFRREQDIRIVTTNFDTLFQRAAAETKISLTSWMAPALPLGDDVRGVIHLHGSVDDPDPRHLVLTADDFGQAYLSRGWARQFILDLYARYTVLFVGYSHSDIPMQYLAYGLRSRGGQPRYALDLAKAEKKWINFGINGIAYPPDSDEGHSNLPMGLRAWLAELKRTPLGVEDRLDQILRSATDPAAAEEDFLIRALQSQSSATHFARYADPEGPRWVKWLDQKGLLKSYLQCDAPTAPREKWIVANWVGRVLARNNAATGLALVERHGELVGNVVWQTICDWLTYEPKLLSTADGRAWLAFLIHARTPRQHGPNLARLFDALATLEEWEGLTLVFESLVDPSIRLVEKGPLAPEKQVEAAITLDAEDHSFQLAWDVRIAPRLSDLAERLAPVIEAALQRSFRILLLSGEAEPHSCEALFTRTNIEIDEYRINARGVDLLANLFGDTLSALCKKRTGRIDDWVVRLVESANPILIRFGLFLLRQSGTMSPADKLQFVIARKLMYPPAHGAIREIYELLKQIYPSVDAEQKIALWRALEAECPQSSSNPEGEIKRDEIDRTCWHLAHDFPTDKEAIAARQRLSARNPKFTQGEPWKPGEFMRDGEPYRGEKSPRTVAELLGSEPSTDLEFLVSYQGDSWPSPSRPGLLQAIAMAAAQNASWMGKLFRSLAANAHWQSDIWPQILSSGRFANLDPTDAQWFLKDALPELLKTADNAPACARFIAHGTKVEEIRALPEVDLTARIGATAQIWQIVRSTFSVQDADPKTANWLNIAINHAPGWLAESWLIIQQVRFERAPDAEAEWPTELVEPVKQITSGTTHADLLGLAVFGQVLTFLRRISPTWTQDAMYPCLEFETFGDKAYIGWRSLIEYGGWTRDLLSDLLPILRRGLDKLVTHDEIGRALTQKIAGIAGTDASLLQRDDWLSTFLASLPPKRITSWTSALARSLGAATPQARSEIWMQWLQKHMHDRVAVNNPPSTGEERLELLRVAVSLRESFPEVVALLRRGPHPHLKHFIPRDIIETDLCELFPEHYLSALEWLLRGMEDHVYADDFFEKLLNRLPPRSSLLPLWTAVCEELSRLTHPKAKELLAAGKTRFAETTGS